MDGDTGDAMMRFALLCLLTLLTACGSTPPSSVDPSAKNPSPSRNPGEEGSSDTSSEDPGESSSKAGGIPLTEAFWTVVYDGYGSVVFDEGGIVMEPMASTSPGETHAALVLAKQTLSSPLAEFCLTIEATTEAQLRDTSPNPWEVFWIFFNAVFEDGHEETNYFILKTNGIELGRAFDGDDEQEFLVTESEPRLGLGSRVLYVLRKSPGRLTVSIDGEAVIDYTNGTDPDFLYEHAGAIGLYTEDARVRVHSVSLECSE